MDSITKRLKDLSINKYALDEEWAEQAKQRYRYHEKISAAMKLRDNVSIDQEEAKQEYKRIHGDLIVQIKTNPKEFGVEKTTDVLCDAIAMNHPTRKEAFAYYIECGRRLVQLDYEVNRLQGMLDSFIDRRKGLEAEISLYFDGYFSQNPKIQQMADAVLGNRNNDQFIEKLNSDPDLRERLIRRKKQKEGSEDD